MTDENLPPEFELEHDMLNEIAGQSHRGAAIVAFAFLDDVLTEAVQSRLHNYKHKGEDVSKFMFKGAGPLATFSARRRLALMLGIVGPKTYDDLDRLAQIRNEFAHIRSRRTFKSQRIRSLCGALTTPTHAKFASRYEQFLPESAVSDARLAYVNTIMFLCGSLRVVAKIGRPPSRKLSPLL